jgi:hypothetical protein
MAFFLAGERAAFAASLTDLSPRPVPQRPAVSWFLAPTDPSEATEPLHEEVGPRVSRGASQPNELHSPVRLILLGSRADALMRHDLPRGTVTFLFTIVLVALLLISGTQFMLFAMWFDMESNKDLR